MNNMTGQIYNYDLALKLGNILQERKLYCATAESCTGGALSAAITEIPGSSKWFDRGFIVYTNESKSQLLSVPAPVIMTYGAVSEETVCAMADGAIINSAADVSIAISGIAGPSGGSLKNPVGTVWIAWSGDLKPTYAKCYLFTGDRGSIRQQAVQQAMQGLIMRCKLKI
jgi:PncC family amidohydrolase